MARDYIERRNDTFYIMGSRVPLHIVIHEYENGSPAESIAHSFPTLSLEQIYGALAFYHGNKAEVEAAMHDVDREWDDFRLKNPVEPSLKKKLERAKEHSKQQD